jgi:hypothetical protein
VDFRGKIQIAKGLAVLRSPANVWLILLLKLLNIIDNDLRPKRNDYVHAQWAFPKSQLVKITRKTKVLKPQAFEIILETEQKISVRFADMKKFRRDLQRVYTGLILFMVTIVKEEERPLPYKSILPHIRRAIRDILPKDARSTPRRLRGSSPALPRGSKHH